MMTTLKTKAIRKLAEKGNAWAQCELGRLSIVSGHSEDVLRWYTKAAEQGYPQALERLALEYFFGKRITQDFEKALMLVIVAGIRTGKRNNGLYHQIAEKLDLDGIKEAQRRADEWRAGIPL